MKYFFVKTTLLGSEIIRNVYPDLDNAIARLIDKYVENDNTPFNYIDAYCGYFYVIEVDDSINTVTDYVKATSDIYRLHLKDGLLLISKRDKKTYKTFIYKLETAARFRLQIINNLYKKEHDDLFNEYLTFVNKEASRTFTLYPTLVKGIYNHRLAEMETNSFFR